MLFVSFEKSFYFFSETHDTHTNKVTVLYKTPFLMYFKQKGYSHTMISPLKHSYGVFSVWFLHAQSLTSPGIDLKHLRNGIFMKT